MPAVPFRRWLPTWAWITLAVGALVALVAAPLLANWLLARSTQGPYTQVELVLAAPDDGRLDQAEKVIAARLAQIGATGADFTRVDSSGLKVRVPGPWDSEQIVELVSDPGAVNMRPVQAISKPAEPNTKTPQQPIQAPGNTAGFRRQAADLDCTMTEREPAATNPGQWLATCDPGGTNRYLLAPAVLTSADIAGATAEPGLEEGTSVVALTLTPAGDQAITQATTALAGAPTPRNSLAIAYDGLVYSTPAFTEPVAGGPIYLAGMPEPEARNLATTINSGPLPEGLTLTNVQSRSDMR